MSATATASATAFPPVVEVDARQQDAITEAQAEAFRQAGLLVIRNCLAPEELALLQRETQTLVDRAIARQGDGDYWYKEHEVLKQEVPYRVEYVVDKLPACRALAGHPFILRSVERLQSNDFIPTWDSLVFKTPGQGASIPWHRDAGTGSCLPPHPIFNVDFYLDRADESNCVWGIPGSNRWSEEAANARNAELNRDLANGVFRKEGCVPVLMNPGDVLLHDILVLHGSAPTNGALRRVVYYEYRPIATELALGPHKPAYIPAKQQVLVDCLAFRRNAAWVKDADPFTYRPSAAHAVPAGPPAGLRFPHEQWFLPQPVKGGF
jgi:ectoine hydroxylase-related dioxygenase (phytanoyl-CoA dioxygenase family)